MSRFLRSLVLLLAAPLLFAGCSFQYACVKSLSLRCAAEAPPAPHGQADSAIQQASFVQTETVTAGCVQPCGRPTWGGIYPTVLTPWNCNGTLDAPALTNQIEYQLAGGVHGLLILGTIGEGEYVSEAGREAVIGATVAAARGRAPVIVGIHSSDPLCAVRQMRQAKQLGAAAVLVKYTGCANLGCCSMHHFYRMLANANSDSQLPIFFYYYPSQTGLTYTPEQIAAVLMMPNVVGIKESTLDLRHIQRQMQLVCGQGKVFLSGTALNLTQFQAIGGHGAMSPEAALLPCRTMNGYRLAYEAGDQAGAREIQEQLFVVAPLLQSLPVTEGMARSATMNTQDRKATQMMGKEASAAKMKAALNGLAVPMSSIVAPPQKQLGRCDEMQVERALPRLRELMP